MKTINNTVPAGLGKYVQENSLVISSPGRINLIGEHTDYNDGFVLPAAIDKAAFLSLTPRNDDKVNLHAIDLNDVYNTTINELTRSTNVSWPNYLIGVAAQFKLKGFELKGFDVALTGNIPPGAGLSSSAAVECAMAFALNIMTGAGLEKLTLARMAQKAEQDFAGVQCGIMDQFASLFGKKDHVIRLDCRSLEYEYVPFNMDGFKVVLFDTNVKHSLASSEYNVRRQQCETGVAMIRQYHPEVKSLRDTTMSMLDKYVFRQNMTVYERCKYVVEENDRLLLACKDLQENNMAAFGKKMFDTHYVLSKLYEVSCPELDFLVSYVKDKPAVLGARMMGGGFGGCTINLVKEDAIDELVDSAIKAYQETMKKELKVYITRIENGTTILQ